MVALGLVRVWVSEHLVAVRAFGRGESGAVTVDWVVLTAATVGLCLGAIGAVRTGALGLGGGLGATLNNATVLPIGTLGSSGL